MDEFKKYLLENRDKLDVENAPSSQVWQHIQQKSSVPKRPVISMTVKWVVAASIVLAAGTGAWFYLHNPSKQETVSVAPTQKRGTPGKEKEQNTDPVKEQPLQPKENNIAITNEKRNSKELASNVKPSPKPKKKSLNAAPEEMTSFTALEKNYSTIISTQLRKLESTPIYAEKPDYFHVFKKQWYDLEKDEQGMKQEITRAGFTDEMLEQLITLYQQKLILLKELQAEINKMNNTVKHYPSLNKSKPSYLKM